MKKILVFVFAGLPFCGTQIARGSEEDDFYNYELPADFSRLYTQPKTDNDDPLACRRAFFTQTKEEFIDYAMQVLSESYYDPYLEEKLEVIRMKEKKKEEKEKERIKELFPTSFREHPAYRSDWSVDDGNENPRRIGREAKAEGGGCCTIQ